MRSHYLELNVDSLMKDKKLEANLSMVASRVMAGLNMNGLKYLLPLWLGALTGVTIRCVFAAVAFWLTGCFIKEAAVTRKQRIMLFCLGAFGYCADDVEHLLEEGFTPEELEDYFYGCE